jgi:hypothetical protein
VVVNVETMSKMAAYNKYANSASVSSVPPLVFSFVLPFSKEACNVNLNSLCRLSFYLHIH